MERQHSSKQIFFRTKTGPLTKHIPDDQGAYFHLPVFVPYLSKPFSIDASVQRSFQHCNYTRFLRLLWQLVPQTHIL